MDYAPLFSALKKGEFKAVDISEGDILKIRSDGVIERDKFEYSYFCGKKWWDYGTFSYTSFCEEDDFSRYNYIEDLKAVATYQGFLPDDIDELINAGFTLDEIEEYIYCSCGGEI